MMNSAQESRPLILIVDDSPVNIKIITNFLENEYDVITANDGQTAIKLATEKMPDLILLDVIMPKMDGLAVCKFLKSQPATVEIPIIFITIVAGAQNIVKALEAGGQDYITKPFNAQELCARIKTHLRLKKSQGALKEYAKKLETENQELSETLTKLEDAAMTDYLTNLANRRQMIQLLQVEAARLKRTDGRMTLVLADIDDFKEINDVYGHDYGDVVLADIANIMKSSVREQDIVSRWGGEEFLMMFPDTDLNGGRIVAEKIRKAVQASIFRYQDKEFFMTITLGVAEFDINLDVDENIKKVDEILYKGKNQSKNCVMIDNFKS